MKFFILIIIHLTLILNKQKSYKLIQTIRCGVYIKIKQNLSKLLD